MCRSVQGTWNKRRTSESISGFLLGGRKCSGIKREGFAGRKEIRNECTLKMEGQSRSM